jgi:hypothetical protein
MKMTADIEQRLSLVEEKAAEHSEKIDSLFRLLGGWLDQHAKQATDTQTTMINARMPERQAKGGGVPTAAPAPAPAPTAAPVQFGSAAPYDAQVGRIDGKRRELLGKK